jgi:hypothetical protein
MAVALSVTLPNTARAPATPYHVHGSEHLPVGIGGRPAMPTHSAAPHIISRANR